MEIRSAAKALIRRSSDGKYLILTSSIWEENPRRSQQPDLPGGLVEAGETVTKGLQRELQEEIGVTIPECDMTLAYASTFVDTDANASTTFLLYYYDTEDIDITLSWEHESFEWLSADDVQALTIREPYPTIFSHFKQIGLLK